MWMLNALWLIWKVTLYVSASIGVAFVTVLALLCYGTLGLEEVSWFIGVMNDGWEWCMAAVTTGVGSSMARYGVPAFLRHLQERSSSRMAAIQAMIVEAVAQHKPGTVNVDEAVKLALDKIRKGQL